MEARHILFPLTMWLLAGGITTLHAETITIAGTGSGTQAMRVLAEDFAKRHPGATITVMPAIGSGGAIKGVQDGTLTLGVSNRLPRGNESIEGVEITELARTPFVFAVAQGNPVSGLSTAELADIYAGKRISWPDGSRLRLIMRPSDDTDTLLLQSQFPPAIKAAVQEALVRPGLLVAATDVDCAELLEQTPGSFGALTLGQIVAERRALKVLSVDGVEPSVEVAMEGRYPYHKVLYLMIAADAEPLAREFHAYARSVRGRELLARLSFWAANSSATP